MLISRFLLDNSRKAAGQAQKEDNKKQKQLSEADDLIEV
jgi:hypothetical protein